MKSNWAEILNAASEDPIQLICEPNLDKPNLAKPNLSQTKPNLKFTITKPNKSNWAEILHAASENTTPLIYEPNLAKTNLAKPNLSQTKPKIGYNSVKSSPIALKFCMQLQKTKSHWFVNQT